MLCSKPHHLAKESAISLSKLQMKTHFLQIWWIFKQLEMHSFQSSSQGFKRESRSDNDFCCAWCNGITLARFDRLPPFVLKRHGCEISISLLHFWQARDFEVEVSLNKSQWLIKPLCALCETMTCSIEHDWAQLWLTWVVFNNQEVQRGHHQTWKAKIFIWYQRGKTPVHKLLFYNLFWEITKCFSITNACKQFF